MAEKPITLLLRAWAHGDEHALNQLTPLVYEELHRLAAAHMRRERRDHTFSTTELVHEAFVRLAGTDDLAFSDRVQFFALAARQMRHILVDHARRRSAEKRGGRDRPVTLDEAIAAQERPEELCALDEALNALAAFDERKARAVELRYFGGMSQGEIAASLGVHENTVARDLRLAEAWLLSRMKSDNV